MTTTFSAHRCEECGSGSVTWTDEEQATCNRCGNEWHDDALQANRQLAPGHAILFTNEHGFPEYGEVVRANRATVTVRNTRRQLRVRYTAVTGYAPDTTQGAS